MTEDRSQDLEDEEYDEAVDSDFDEQVSEGGSSQSSDDGDHEVKVANVGKSRKPVGKVQEEELDSGDEVTIKERQKAKKKQKRRKDGAESTDDEKDEGWRAKTRSMRAQAQEEKQMMSLASVQASTIDVDKIWEEMNKLGPLPPIYIEGAQEPVVQDVSMTGNESKGPETAPLVTEEMITIKRQFKFAGEIHNEEKVVPKSSAEAQLWLAQQSRKDSALQVGSESHQRPLRKISKFDPNYSNHEAFRNHAIKAQPGAFRGPKLNVVEKSKMDWASHVDTEGLKDELAVHAKAKGAYHNRMDFLDQVGQRREDEARMARQKG